MDKDPKWTPLYNQSNSIQGYNRPSLMSKMTHYWNRWVEYLLNVTKYHSSVEILLVL
jgi:hypothetical protein